MKVINKKMALFISLLIAVAVPVFAYVYSLTLDYTKQIPVGVVVRYPIPAQFGVYWNYECTMPVTFIDFGEIPQPRTWMSLYKTIYIRNEQPDKRIWIYWNSTLRDATTQISESWISNGTMIEPGSYYWSSYYLSIPTNVDLGTYNWTITIWAEY